MCKTKIVATLGPACHSRETLRDMIKAGVNVVRLNFSHGSAEEHTLRARMVRQLASELNKSVGILADLQGPKIRISCFEEGAVQLCKGDTFYLDSRVTERGGDKFKVGLDYPQLIQDIQVDNILLLDDGRLRLKVTEVDDNKEWIETRVLNSGKLSDRKGINLLGGGLSAPALTEKDKRDILTAAEIQADFLAVSFPRNAEDIAYARELARRAGCNADIVAKVERAEVIDSPANMDELILASDAIMVARGDLAVEIGDERLPFAQKNLIARARHFGKPIITATQMMESMIENPVPTRAEVLDIANAIIDGTDAIMLSAESAAGKFPVEAVETMVRIARGAEQDIKSDSSSFEELQPLCEDTERSFAVSAMVTASKAHKHLGVVVLSRKGETPRLMSRCNSKARIWALSSDRSLLGKFTLLRGVTPLYFEYPDFSDTSVSEAVVRYLRDEVEAHKISSLLITQFESVDGSGTTNVCRLLTLDKREIAA